MCHPGAGHRGALPAVGGSAGVGSTFTADAQAGAARRRPVLAVQRSGKQGATVFVDELLPIHPVSDEVATGSQRVWEMLLDACLLEVGRRAPLAGVPVQTVRDAAGADRGTQ